MTAIPITSEGRALCGFVTQTNSVNTNKVRNIGWRDSGVADKMSQIWEELSPIPCNLYSDNNYASTLVGGKREKKTLPHCGRFCFLWEQLYRRSSYLSRSVEKLGRVFENVTEKLLIVPFVCPFLTFSTTDFQFGRNMGISSCLLQQQ